MSVSALTAMIFCYFLPFTKAGPAFPYPFINHSHLCKA
ncbi:hypothetical protein Pint_34695 [Pistacia integerrima]|uniref:Uncharacterized protein n=1 Tax=Pistacia integerrima TaxID=434235 RepID=A0ACC0X5H1_9ROSI|nr:hypothetical protein Pint_34695 [Pistacia integerrima]